jgi:hypothetical protein
MEVDCAKDIARNLVEDDNFYHECMETTQKLYNKLYIEDKFVKHFDKVVDSL